MSDSKPRDEVASLRSQLATVTAQLTRAREGLERMANQDYEVADDDPDDDEGLIGAMSADAHAILAAISDTAPAAPVVAPTTGPVGRSAREVAHAHVNCGTRNEKTKHERWCRDIGACDRLTDLIERDRADRHPGPTGRLRDDLGLQQILVEELPAPGMGLVGRDRILDRIQAHLSSSPNPGAPASTATGVPVEEPLAVYAVQYSNYDPAEIAVLCSTRELAEWHRDRLNKSYGNSMWEVVKWDVEEDTIGRAAPVGERGEGG
jgi:hypothetical protein